MKIQKKHTNFSTQSSDNFVLANYVFATSVLSFPLISSTNNRMCCCCCC